MEVLGEHFLWFLKSDLLRFHHNFLLFGKSNLLLIRRTIAHLCLNINFDAVDFSERRSEEVMFLLTLSAFSCILLKYTKFCQFWSGQTFWIWWQKNNQISHPHSTGLIIPGAVWVKHFYTVQNKSQFLILGAVLLWKTICLGVQSHPKTRVTLNKVQQ